MSKIPNYIDVRKPFHFVHSIFEKLNNNGLFYKLKYLYDKCRIHQDHGIKTEL